MKFNKRRLYRFYLRYRNIILKIIEVLIIVGALWSFFGAGYYLGVHDIHPFTFDNVEYQLK